MLKLIKNENTDILKQLKISYNVALLGESKKTIIPFEKYEDGIRCAIQLQDFLSEKFSVKLIRVVYESHYDDIFFINSEELKF